MKNCKPTISIVVPVYNTELFLAECIKSILNQTFSDFELILIDDGSTDKSGDICDEYSKQDLRIIVIHQTNQGVSVCRNKGIEISRGKFISFIDSDDYVDKEFLSCLIEQFNDGVDMTRCNAISFGGDMYALFNYKFKGKSLRIGNDKEYLSFLIQDFFNYSIGFEVFTSLYRKDLISKFNIRFPEGIKIGEDIYFLLKYLMFTKVVLLSNKPLYHYRVRPCSAMRNSISQLEIDGYNKMSKSLYDFVVSDFLKKKFCSIHIKLVCHEFQKINFLTLKGLFLLKKAISKVQDLEYFKTMNSAYYDYYKTLNNRSLVYYSKKPLFRYLSRLHFGQLIVSTLFYRFILVPINTVFRRQKND